jgi:hypothetical protein
MIFLTITPPEIRCLKAATWGLTLIYSRARAVTIAYPQEDGQACQPKPPQDDQHPDQIVVRQPKQSSQAECLQAGILLS